MDPPAAGETTTPLCPDEPAPLDHSIESTLASLGGSGVLNDDDDVEDVPAGASLHYDDIGNTLFMH